MLIDKNSILIHALICPRSKSDCVHVGSNRERKFFHKTTFPIAKNEVLDYKNTHILSTDNVVFAFSGRRSGCLDLPRFTGRT